MPEPLLTGALIVSLSRTYWDDVWRSRHQVMTRLATTNDVLFVSRARPRGMGPGRVGLQEVQPHLHTYEPPAWLPYVPGRPLVERAFDGVRRHLLRQLVQRRRAGRPVVLYLWDPGFVTYLDAFPDALVCYHLFDELTLYAGADGARRGNQLHTVLERADLFVAASQPLAEKYGQGRNVHICPNGVDLDVFAPHAAGVPEIEGRPGPRLVYSGSLRAQIDIDVLDELASLRPDWTMVLVGDIAENVRELPATVRLQARANVIHLGRRSQQDVARAIASCDVALAPYRLDGAASFCSPLKIPEYLAVGLPVVATPVQGATVFVPHVRLATRAGEWVEQVTAALDERDVASREARRASVQSFSWDARVDQIRLWLEGARRTSAHLAGHSGS